MEEEVLRTIGRDDLRVNVSDKALLALLTTEQVEKYASGPHTRSVLLMQPDWLVERPIVVDNLQFHLFISVHEKLPISELINALHETYFNAHYSVEAIWRLKLQLLGPGSTEQQQLCELHHPLYKLTQSFGENYQLHQGGGGEEEDEEEVRLPVSTLYCIKQWQSFEPSAASKIYNKLKKGRSGTKKCPIQNQWRLTFDNHLVVQYFIERLQRPLYIQRQPCEVRVLCAQRDRTVSFFDYGSDTSQRYVLDQLPQFRSANDSFGWSFTHSFPLERGYIHNGSMERDEGQCEQLVSKRVGLNRRHFELTTTLWLVNFATRIQSVLTDALVKKMSQVQESTIQHQQVEKTNEQMALEELNAQQQAVRTSRPKQPLPGQTKRLAQGRLDFTQCKKPRTELGDPV